MILQTCLRISSYEPPTLANSVGLVVTPSRTPQRAAVLISSMSAVSRKIFIGRAPSGARVSLDWYAGLLHRGAEERDARIERRRAGLPGRACCAASRRPRAPRHARMRSPDERDDAGGVRRGHRRAVQPGVVVAGRILDQPSEGGLEVEIARRRRIRREDPPASSVERRRLVPRAARGRHIGDVAVGRVPGQQVLGACRGDDDDARRSPGGRTTHELLTGRVTAAPGREVRADLIGRRMVQVDALVAGGRDEHDAPLLGVLARPW